MSRLFTFVVGVGVGLWCAERYDMKAIYNKIFSDPNKFVEKLQEEEKKYRKKD